MAGRQAGQYPQQCEDMKEKIILIGGGGHCRACIDVIEQEGRFTIAGIVDVPEKSEVKRLLGSNEKIRRLTGWQPGYTLQQGIRETIAWFRDEGNLQRYKCDVYNV